MENNAMNDEKINKIVNIILICVGAILGILVLDLLVLKIFGVGPIFAVKDKSSTDNVKISNAVFYKVYRCDVKKYPHDVVVKLFGAKYDCDKAPIKGIKKDDFVIQNETNTCVTGLHEIARDNRYIYYLSCMKSTTVFIKYGSGERLTLKEALSKKKVTIQELMEKQDKDFKIFQEAIAK